MELFTTSPYLFDKQQTGEYTIKASITNVGDTINFAHGSAYTDDTLSFEVSDGKITKASLTIDDWWSTITDSITFEYSGYTLSSDYTTALTSMTEFVTPTNWVDFDSEIGAELIEFLGSEDLAKQVPFIYTSLVDLWSVFESVDYDGSTYEIIAGTEYINIYPGDYESSNSDALLTWLNSYNTLLENDASWTELDSTSKGRVFSNGSIKVTVGTSVLSGLYIQKVSA